MRVLVVEDEIRMVEGYEAPDEKTMRTAADAATERCRDLPAASCATGPPPGMRPHIVLSQPAHQRARILGTVQLTSFTWEQAGADDDPSRFMRAGRQVKCFMFLS